MTQTLLLLPGDGIGPEVTEEACRVAKHVMPELQIETAFFGGVSYDHFGTPLTDEVMAQARKSDAILMGAVGGPKWDGVPRDKRPEAALLRIRKELDVYANLRPAFCFPALAGASALKPELVEGLDIMIVRELTSGVYFGQPKHIETLPNGERRGVDTQSYTTERDPPRRRPRLRTGARPQARLEVRRRALVREIQRHGFRPALARGSDERCTRNSTAT